MPVAELNLTAGDFAGRLARLCLPGRSEFEISCAHSEDVVVTRVTVPVTGSVAVVTMGNDL